AADQIKLVDIEPDELIDRLSNGQIYQKERAEKALDHFFTIKNLTALRETALRRIADTIQQKNFEKTVNEHILVGVSSSPTSAKVIRTAARLVQSLHAKFTCLYVALDDVEMSSEDELRLKSNLKLAEQLGATIITVKDDGIVSAIANYAQISGVTKIVVGKTLSQGRTFPRR
ncbi:MAG: universal stress protein, partial [Kurthia sp.]